MEIIGKRALLTGATGGLGRAIATEIAERGATLLLSGRRESDLSELAAALPGTGHEILPTDLAEPGAAVELCERAGLVEILIANAGLPGTGLLNQHGPEVIERALRVNLEVPMLMTQQLMGPMLARGEGHLVYIASLAGKAASPRSSIYNATKFGLRGFALGLMADLAGGPVGASLVSPGFVRDAGMFADSGASSPAGLGTAKPGQVSRAVVEAIERNRMEIAVAPLQQRVMSHVGLAVPSLSLRVQSSKAGQRAAASVAAGQREKT